jgi:hypothetical protein
MASFDDLLKSSKHWYHPKSGTLHTLNAMETNHSLDVFQNPEKYGLTREQLPEKLEQQDYDGATLYAAMREGWVRIYIDRRNPDTNSNIEGVKLLHLRPTARLIAETNPHLRRLIMVLRTGTGSREGDAFVLDPESIDFFLRKGRPPPGSKVSEDIDAIKRRAGIITEAGAGMSRIVQHIRNGVPFMAISARRGERSPEENKKADARLREFLSNSPVSFIRIEGKYDETLPTGEREPSYENSYFVMPRTQTGNVDTSRFAKFARFAANKFDQEGVLFGNGAAVYFMDSSGDYHRIGDVATFDTDLIDEIGEWSQIKKRRFSFVDKDEYEDYTKRKGQTGPKHATRYGDAAE